VQLLSGGGDQLLVVDQAGRLVGLLTHAHVLHWLQIRDTLHVPSAPPPGAAPVP